MHRVVAVDAGWCDIHVQVVLRREPSDLRPQCPEGSGAQDIGVRVQGFRVQGSGFRVQGSGFRV